MADFPSMYYTEASSIAAIDGRVNVRATNGALKTRVMYPSRKREFNLTFEMTSTQKSTLDTFYDDNKSLNFTYTDPATSTAHSCRFLDPPQYTGKPGGWFICTVRLGEV